MEEPRTIRIETGGITSDAIRTMSISLAESVEVFERMARQDHAARRAAEAMPPRAERRRRAAVQHLEIPPRLDVDLPGWDRRLLDVIDVVYVSGVPLAECHAYDGPGSRARGPDGVWHSGMIIISRKRIW